MDPLASPGPRSTSRDLPAGRLPSEKGSGTRTQDLPIADNCVSPGGAEHYLHEKRLQAAPRPAWWPRGQSCVPGRTVFLNAQATDGGYPSIVPDDHQGAHDLVTELLDRGHRRIGFINDEAYPVAAD